MLDKLPYFRWRTHKGKPIQIGDRELIPISSVLMLHWSNGGFVLNRPVAIEVNRDNESIVIKIVDFQHIVRLVLLTAISIQLVVRLLIWTQTRRSNRDDH